jgi:pimeloyl-ACP methyl ester carboxylesterase
LLKSVKIFFEGKWMAEFTDGYWQSADGLRLHYRDYAGPVSRTPLLCIGGLTRNARDFEPLAELLKGKRRIIAVDLRGRGESAYTSDAAQYVPETYAGDIALLLNELGLKKFIAFGTSLGGIVFMLLAQHYVTQMKGLVLNDIGPEIGSKGIEHIRSYVGQARSFDTWIHAAWAMADTQAAIYPHYKVEDWLAFAKRTCKLSGNGRIILDYDMKIADPFKAASDKPAMDLWPLYEALGDMPVLILRGETSTILEKTIANKMAKRLSHATLITIKGVGHAPALTEADAQEAVINWLVPIK